MREMLVKCTHCYTIMAAPLPPPAIEFQCPNCDEDLVAEKALLGQEVECPSCACQLVLPSEMVEETRDVESSGDDEQWDHALV